MPRTPTCVLSDSAPPSVTDGHALDRYVPLASVTKVLTATALTRMTAAGLLTPDDPVERWLPSAAPGTGITLHHLAAHTSGLPRLPPGRLPRRDPYARFDRPALDRLLPRLDTLAVRPPGEEEYSNLGYAVLGAALTEAAGTTYDALVTRHVLDPLDLTEITSAPPPDQRLLAPGLLGRPRRPWTMDGAILPAGGLWATPRATADLIVRLLVERRLGDPAPAWQQAGPLHWHNGATRHASLFTGALNDGRWLVLHRLNAQPEQTDRMGIGLLRDTTPD
ncbi:serine hydrolase domain-containing protein [Streptomyces sp. NPDC086091]|uniref:serine hydrolase domain-containing protein n=1 Tax=Streptomyces sp. NPDC086091 TaxID=3365751 RepID=UPI00381CAFCA